MPMRWTSLPRTPARRPRRVLACACSVAIAAAAGCGGPVPTPEAPAPEAEPTAAPAARADTSIGSVERDPVRDQSFARIEELIAGRAAGVQVIRRPDGGFSLRIRGLGSPAGGNDPLLLVDGMPIHPSQFEPVLSSLHPQDVVRIEVLKDAASTAFYGMRGANGVVVITTRRR